MHVLSPCPPSRNNRRCTRSSSSPCSSRRSCTRSWPPWTTSSCWPCRGRKTRVAPAAAAAAPALGARENEGGERREPCLSWSRWVGWGGVGVFFFQRVSRFDVSPPPQKQSIDKKMHNPCCTQSVQTPRVCYFGRRFAFFFAPPASFWLLGVHYCTWTDRSGKPILRTYFVYTSMRVHRKKHGCVGSSKRWLIGFWCCGQMALFSCRNLSLAVAANVLEAG